MTAPMRANDDVAAEAPAVVGYVEAMTESAAIGWVWMPGRKERVSVDLRLAEQTISTAVADQMRDDLKQSGIGDGCHAFSLPVGESFRSRLDELRVFASARNGAAIALGAPALGNGVSDAGHSRIERGIDALIGSQRLIHRNLQSALLQRGAADRSALRDVLTAQASLNESIATIELFVVRLEDALRSRDTTTVRYARSPILIASIVLSTLALIASSFALTHVILGS